MRERAIAFTESEPITERESVTVAEPGCVSLAKSVAFAASKSIAVTVAEPIKKLASDAQAEASVGAAHTADAPHKPRLHRP